MKRILLCVSAAVLLLTACDKDDDEPAAQTPTVANITGTYKITGSTAGGINVFDNSNASMNMYEACDRDDTYTFGTYSAPATTGTMTVTDAGTQCSPSNSYTGSWGLPSSSTINIDGSTWTINSFNGTTLVVSQSLGGGQNWVETYTRQ